MKLKLSLSLISMLIASPAFSQGKLDTRSILFSNLEKAELNSAEIADSCDQSRRRVRAMMPGVASDGRQLTEVMINLAREMSEEELEALGVEDPVVLGSVAAGYVDINDISELEKSDDILSISLSGKGKLHCDVARADTGVAFVRAGAKNLPQGYDGTGVIVSLYDQGIEPGHINFLTADRTESRVKRIWHYQTEYNTFGSSKTKETTYADPEAIAEFETDDETMTHGTHTMGIMTGAFGVLKEDPKHDYSGMAPNSDILIGCGSLSYNNVIRAIKRFKTYADTEGKPLVVNLSFGDNIGPHDGSDAFPKALNELAATIPVFMSAGNEGKTKIALNKRFTEEDNRVMTVITPRSTIRNYLGASWEAASEVQIWSEDETPFTVQTGLWDKSEGEWVFELPTAADGKAAYIANGAYKSVSNYESEDFDYLYQDSAIGISTGLERSNNRYTADIWYLLDKRTNHIDRNIIPVLIVTGEPGKRIDIYCDGEYNEFDTAHQEGWDAGSADGTISNIASGKNTIAVGSYCTRSMTSDAAQGEVSEFSSWGVMYDGRLLPDILAPGESLASSMSTPFTKTDYYNEQTNPAVYGMMYGEDNPFYWTIMSGTSQASPAMAGIAALWLQADPNLSPAEIKRIAAKSARKTKNMTPQCGPGKVDAYVGLKMVLSNAAVENVSDTAPSTILFTLQNGVCTIDNALETPFMVQVFDIAGRLAAQYNSANGTAIQFGGDNEIPSGIYMIKVVTPTETLTKKSIL